jgi:Ni/Co efflux regulator RcnB
MKKLFLALFVLTSLTLALHAENNESNRTKVTAEHNTSKKEVKKEAKKEASKKETSKKPTQEELEAQQVKEQMEREQKYAKEQKFYQGDEYDLKAVEVNQKSLESLPVIEPDYDFDITDVYRDDI